MSNQKITIDEIDALYKKLNIENNGSVINNKLNTGTLDNKLVGMKSIHGSKKYLNDNLKVLKKYVGKL